MSARDLPPGPTTQRSAEHQEKLHRPVNHCLSQANGSMREPNLLVPDTGKLLKVQEIEL